MFSNMTSALHTAVDLIFPPCCALCHARLPSAAEVVCPDCAAQLSPLASPSCERCGMPLDLPDQACAACAGRTFHFVRARAALEFNQPVQRLVHLLKYRDRRSVGRYLGQWVGKVVVTEGWFSHIDSIVPVPLHAARLRERGYNQAEVIAQGLSAFTGLRVDPAAVIRRKMTKSQTRLTIEERRRNVNEVFGVPAGRNLSGARIVLVDDVFTTGATLDSCARALVETGGAETVYALTVARA